MKWLLSSVVPLLWLISAMGCGDEETTGQIATSSASPQPPSISASESVCRREPTPRAIPDSTHSTGGGLNVFCGIVTIDGKSAPDGTKIRLFDFCSGTDVDPLYETLVSSGAYRATALASFGPPQMPRPASCFWDTLFIRVGRRWANETVQRVEGEATIRADLTVTDPPLIPIPDQPTQRIDPRLHVDEQECEQPNIPPPYLVASYYEDRRPDAMVKYALDFVPVPHVSVQVPELGLEGTTDDDGCLVLSGFEFKGPQLVTIIGEKDGYGSNTSKNVIFRGENTFLGSAGELRRDGVPTVSDSCFYPYPPAAAGEAIRAEECRAMGALPPFLARNCEHPGVRRQSAFDPNLRVLTGVVNDAETGAGIAGASLEIAEYELLAGSVEGGCYNFGEFPTNGTEWVTVTVIADGYERITLKNFLLGTLSAHDFALRKGSGTAIEDYCRLGIPENQTWIGREVACRDASLLQWEVTP